MGCIHCTCRSDALISNESNYQQNYIKLEEKKTIYDDAIAYTTTDDLNYDNSSQLLKIKPNMAIKLLESIGSNTNNVVAIFVRFTKMKQINDISHDSGDICLSCLQLALETACYKRAANIQIGTITCPTHNKFSIWRISVATYVAIIEQNISELYIQHVKKQLKIELDDGMSTVYSYVCMNFIYQRLRTSCCTCKLTTIGYILISILISIRWLLNVKLYTHIYHNFIIL